MNRKSHYVPSGNPNNMRYRFSTFKNFPVLDSNYRQDLAEQGFIYTGHYATIKCAGCQIEIKDIKPAWECVKLIHQSDCKYNQEIHKPPPRTETMVIQRPSRRTGAISFIDFYQEKERLKTFENWPTDQAPLLPEQLAKTGFYYTGIYDRTQCARCNIILQGWRREHNPETEHKLRSPYCSWVHPRSMRGNQPMSESERMEANLKYCNMLRENNVIPILNRTRRDEIVKPQLPLKKNVSLHQEAMILAAAGHLNFVTFGARMASFIKEWLSHNAVTSPEDLALAGYYYREHSHDIECFHCHDIIQKWNLYDNPWIEHARLISKCQYMVHFLGRDYVRRMTHTYGPRHKYTTQGISEPKESTHQTGKPALQHKNPACSVCLIRDVNVLFHPCSHVATCQQCSERVTTCPTCRSDIIERLRAYVV